MKKLILMVIMLVGIGMTASAQNTNFGIGLNLGYGSEVSKPSIGVKALYDINEQFTVAPSFNYYFQEKFELLGVETKQTCWDLNLDVHWNFHNQEKYRLYPLVGVSYFNVKASAGADFGSLDIEYSDSEGKVGVNLGFGGQLALTENLAATAEVKYQIISDFNQFVPSLSLIYKF